MNKHSFIMPVCVGVLLISHGLWSSSQAADTLCVPLAEIYRMADNENRLIQLSEQALRAANEGVKQARNAMLPHLQMSLTGSYIGDATLMSRTFSSSGTTDVIYAGLGVQSVKNGQQPTPHWGNMFSFEATQVIYSGGALSAGLEMAKTEEHIAELNVDKNRQEVRLMLTGLYLDLVKLYNQLQVTDKHIALTEKVLIQMQSRANAGVVLHSDLTRYELQLKQLQLARIRLQDTQSIIHHQLITALHQDERTIITPDTITLAAEYIAIEQAANEELWQNIANESNLTIQQAKAVAQLTEQQVRMTRSSSIPNITLIAKDELFGPYVQDLIPVNANINSWFIGIGIQYNLGSLWHNNRAIRKVKIEHQMSQTGIELAKEQVNNSVHAAYIHFLTAFTEVETQEKQVQLADENYELVEKRYNNELALLTDLLDASSIKLQADMALVSARVGLLYAYYQLKYTTHSL